MRRWSHFRLGRVPSQIVRLAGGFIQFVHRGVMIPRRRLPPRIEPLEGQAIDSWLEATAQHMDTTVGALARLAGLSVASRPAWVRCIAPEESNALHAATGDHRD